MSTTLDKIVSNGRKREVTAKVGPLEMSVSLDARYAKVVRNSMPYRYVIGPALRRLRPQPQPNGLRTKKSGKYISSTSYRAGLSVERPVLLVRDAPPEVRKILEKIADYEWYHSIDLPHGVTTPGYVDHREQLKYYNLPEDMTGMRVLDVATFDGFWAFEFERRGADVVAIDLASLKDVDVPRNWRDMFEKGLPKEPKGRGFEIAKSILGSKVKKEICSVYDVSPERLGMFDMVFCSDLLIHLRDPLAAMEAISTVTKNFAVFADVYNPALEAQDPPVASFCMAGNSDIWWLPSRDVYKVWLFLARFSRVEEQSATFVLNSRFEGAIPKVVFHAYR
ncbi:MAG: hypothetical protein Q7T33_03100 [Dehalococcoidia bacterium]|nr:hypothetical protein [Dehalococcoidia bacterium]